MPQYCPKTAEGEGISRKCLLPLENVRKMASCLNVRAGNNTDKAEVRDL